MMANGRTWRRKRKKKKDISKSTNIPCSVDAKDIALFKWAKHQGFDWKGCHLKVYHFSDTGRGMMATKKITKDSVIVSVPYHMLVHSTSVMEGYIGETIRRHNLRGLTHTQILCCFLMCERGLRERSAWSPYINSVPETYTTPAYWQPGYIDLLPPWIKTLADKHIQDLQSSYQQAKPLMSALGKDNRDLMQYFTYDLYRWAWTTINTRAVYMKQKCDSEYLSDEGENNLALAPVLDFLNHSCHVEVKASFNTTTQTYDISTLQSYSRGDQVFISYGPHDNTKLLIEYGFVVPSNPQDAVPFSLDDITALADEKKISQKELKFQIIKDESLISRNTTCSLDGLSWNLQLLLTILALPAQKIHAWKDYKMGKELEPELTAVYRSYTECLLSKKVQQIPNLQYEDTSDNYHKKLIADINNIQRQILLHCIEDFT